MTDHVRHLRVLIDDFAENGKQVRTFGVEKGKAREIPSEELL